MDSKRKRKKKSSITRSQRKPARECPGEAANVLLACDGKLTDFRADLIGDACAIVDVLQPYIDALPWENTYDADGDVVQLVRKFHSLYQMGKYVAAGWEMLVSSAVAEFIYDNLMTRQRAGCATFGKSLL